MGFIKEIRTAWGNTEVPQTFFNNFPYSRKYVLIRLTPYHLQPTFHNFVTSQKAYCRSGTGSLGLEFQLQYPIFQIWL